MQGKLTQRSMQDELLDSPNVPARLLVQNLRELDFLNRKTGAHRVSLEGIKKLMKDKDRLYHIVDLGCGSGDWLRYMAEWARKSGFKLRLTGVDKNPNAIKYLKSNSSSFPEIESITGDYMKPLEYLKVDIFHCSLFCHHLNDEELVDLLRQMNKTAGIGFVINDLRRSLLAYYGAKLFTRIFRGSPLSRHDGPVSVMRGFKKKELVTLIKKAGVTEYLILKRPFFRFLVLGGKVGNAKNKGHKTLEK